MRKFIYSIIIAIRDIKILGLDFFVIKYSIFRESHDWKKIFKVIAVIGISILVIYHAPKLLKAAYSADWTGFGSILLINGQVLPKKTLWDWMELLIIPIVLSISVLLFNRSERKNSQKIERDKNRDQVLRNYFDQIPNLIFYKSDFLNEEEQSQKYVIARARTLSILESMDGNRKGIIIRFLFELGLIDHRDTKVKLFRANLTNFYYPSSNLDHVDLRGANLDNATLQWTKFFDGNLSGTSLRNADLRNASFRKANLEYALLNNSDMYSVNLEEARLGKSQMINTRLANAYLPNAYLPNVEMKNTNLRKAMEFPRFSGHLTACVVKIGVPPL